MKSIRQCQRTKARPFVLLSDCQSPKKSYTQMPVFARLPRDLGWQLFKFDLSAGKRVIR